MTRPWPTPRLPIFSENEVGVTPGYSGASQENGVRECVQPACRARRRRVVTPLGQAAVWWSDPNGQVGPRIYDLLGEALAAPAVAQHRVRNPLG
jgi:hypothetical protein